MKKTIVCLAALGAGMSYAGAQELSISSSFAWESEYIFRGVQFADEYFAPSVDLAYGGFYAGIWAALPFDLDRSMGEVNEVDYYGGYAMDVSETVGLDFGATYYTFDSQDDFFDSDVNTFEVYTGISMSTALSPAFYVYYDFDLETLTFEGSVGHSIEVGETSTVDFSASAGWVEPDVGDSYLYYGASASYFYGFTENAGLSIGLNYYGADEDLMYGGDGNTLTYSFSFSAGF